MDEDLYDEFGNLIGDPLDSDAESSDEDVQLLPSRFLNVSEPEEEDAEMSTEENQVVLQEDKQYYASMSETFGPDVETVVQLQDTQDINEPIVKPLERKTFQLQELELPETTYSKDYMLEVAKLPERVRNVLITGDLHSGKTTFIDMLILQTHLNLQYKGNNLRYTDSHKLENSRGLSLKTVPMTMVLPNIVGKSYVVNILDTPGHLNFLDEVSVAQSTLDSTAIVIDAVQGLSKMDKLIIQNCLRKDIAMAIVINKIDRLILELRLPPLDSYLKLKYILDEVNEYIQSELDTTNYSYQSTISPELGNVCFASSLYQFCFTLNTFVLTLYGKKQTDKSTDMNAFAEQLWGDVYYENGVFTQSPQDKTQSSQNRSFVKFVLDPLYKIFNNVLTKSEDELPQFLYRHFQLKVDKKIYRLDPQTLLITILQQILGTSAGFVDMLENAPSPSESLSKILKEFDTTDADIETLVLNCDSENATIAHITKLLDTVDSKRFYGLVKVVSGNLNLTHDYKVLGENFDDDEEDVLENEKFSKLYINCGRYKIPVESISAGNVGLIMSDNLDKFITKSGTIYDSQSTKKHFFKPLDYMIHSVFKVAVEPKNPAELHKLLEGFRKINRAYPGSEIKVEESGEHVVLGSGELYLDCLLHDLRKLYTEIEIKISDPLTKFAETCVEKSTINLPIKSANGLNKVSIIIEPLEKEILQDIENEIISMKQPTRKLAKWFREKYGWDSLASRSIMTFGSSHIYPNILLDDTLPDEVDKQKLSLLKNFIVQGFQWATREGPLCDEPIRNLKFKIIKFDIAEDMIDCNGGQIIPMIRNACYALMLLATPKLMELIYSLDMIVKLSLDQDAQFLIDGMSDMLSKRRGHVISWSPIPATQFYRINGTVPVLDSVGLETDIRVRTQGQAMCFMSFDKWDLVPGDPLDKHLFLPTLKPVPYKSLARDCLLKTRKRKGLNGEPDLSKFVELTLLQELKDGGIIDDEE